MRCWRSASRRWKAAAPASPCASGHAAQLLALHTLMGPGDKIVAARQLYGGSINQFSQGFAKFDWHVELGRRARSRQLQARDHRRRPRRSSSKASPIPAASSPTSRRSPRSPMTPGVPLIVDNTLASPYLIRPIEWGADIVLHSGHEIPRRPRQLHGRRDRGWRQVRLGQRQISHAVASPAPPITA